MNSLLRKGIGIFKVKNINVYLDDEWILCDLKNNTTNENLTKNNPHTSKCDNLPKNFDTYIYSHSNYEKKSYTNKKPNITNNISTNNNKNHLPLKTSLLPIINEDHSFISCCYDVFMNIIDEIELLKALFLYNNIEISLLGI